MNETERMFYELAADEVAGRNLDKALAAKAYSECNGDESKSIARYIALRVEQLGKEYRQATCELAKDLKNASPTSTRAFPGMSPRFIRPTSSRMWAPHRARRWTRPRPLAARRACSTSISAMPANPRTRSVPPVAPSWWIAAARGCGCMEYQTGPAHRARRESGGYGHDIQGQNGCRLT
jgi:hypothetical protein